MIEILGLIASIIAIISFSWKFKWIREKLNKINVHSKKLLKKTTYSGNEKKPERIKFPPKKQ